MRGGNVGVYTVSVARRFPNVKIIAFEPDRINCAQFHASSFLNAITDSVEVHAFALSDLDTTVIFQRHGDDNRGVVGRLRPRRVNR